jgi:phosphate transport system permease protein
MLARMDATASSITTRTRRLGDRIGDRILHGLTAAAALLSVALVAAIVWRIIDGAIPAIEHYGIDFIWSTDWNPVLKVFGAASFIVGTLLTSLLALALAAPLSIGIALYLTELAPRFLRGPVTALVEMLAAVPSVVIGLWGIFVMAPFVSQHIEPFLIDTLGWLPFFSGPASPSGVFPAMLVLTIMIIPISSSICRELFIGVPDELEEGSLALGATRWEMVRGVVIPSVKGGVVAAIILGLGRAFGEAIAVTQVIGNSDQLHRSIFQPGDTLASRLANQYQGAVSDLQISALIYLALILLAITFVTNVVAQLIVRRFDRQFSKA